MAVCITVHALGVCHRARDQLYALAFCERGDTMMGSKFGLGRDIEIHSSLVHSTPKRKMTKITLLKMLLLA